MARELVAPPGRSTVIYTRISRDKEGEALGVARQEEECRELAKRLGLVVSEVFSDNDIGASVRSRPKPRPGFEAMVQQIREERIGTVLSYSSSRLSRRFADLGIFEELHKGTGVVFRTVVSGDDDLSTADGLMVARIKASIDAAESDRLSERMKSSLRQKAMAGEPRTTSHRPFGWEKDGKTIREEEAALVREGVRLLASGVALNVIKKDWEARGIKTPSGGSTWHWTNLRSVLLSPRVVGIRTYKKEVLYDAEGSPVRGLWEPLVSEEEWEAALAQVEKRKVGRKRKGKYLLTGLVRCGECWAPMWGSMGNGGRPDSYLCSGGSGHVAIKAESLEALVREELATRLTTRLTRGQEEVEVVKEPQAWPREEELSAVVKAIEDLMSAWREKRLSSEVVFPELARLEPERDALRKEREAWVKAAILPRRLDSFQASIQVSKQVWGEDEKLSEAAIRSEIQTIVIAKGVKGRHRADSWEARERIARRVEIVWNGEAQPDPEDPETINVFRLS